MLEKWRLHHIGILVDSGPRIITFIIDGKVCDGGDSRQFGWGRFSPHLRDLNGNKKVTVLGERNVSVKELNIYDRALMNSEIISNYNIKPFRKLQISCNG
jgi:hypothetical protein